MTFTTSPGARLRSVRFQDAEADPGVTLGRLWFGGFHRGISWKWRVHKGKSFSNGWWLGVPPSMETTMTVWLSYRNIYRKCKYRDNHSEHQRFSKWNKTMTHFDISCNCCWNCVFQVMLQVVVMLLYGWRYERSGLAKQLVLSWVFEEVGQWFG